MPLVVDRPDELVFDIGYWERLFQTPSSTVTVTRTSPEDFKQRQLIISLDGQKIGTLLFGEGLTRDIDPGPHRLRVSNTLVWKTIEFTVKAGEQIRFEAVNRPGRGTYTMLLIVGVGPLYVTVTRLA
jgi:hypothetical protein